MNAMSVGCCPSELTSENGTGPKARLGVPIQKRKYCAGSVLFNGSKEIRCMKAINDCGLLSI